MRATVIIILAIGMPCLTFAQTTAKISGIIKDAKEAKPLEGATISVLDNKTGIFVNHAVSNKRGEFIVSGLPQQLALDVIVSFMGFRDTTASILIPAKTKLLSTGTWNLKPGEEELEQVVVTARKPPFIVKKDTLEFDATAFKSLPTDMVQDLLRKLPGMVIDELGNVTVNGKKVNKIQVDGRDFFSGDLATATQNLPGAIIEKVQVYEARERGKENNSIIKPISENVTLNLTLKKENKKGLFGKLGGGYGTRDRYNVKGSVNSFNEGKRVSLTGNTGNGGSPLVGMRGPGMMPGLENTGGNGVLRNSTGGGINLNNDFGSKVKFDAGYWGNANNTFNETSRERTNILPDSSFLYNSHERSEIKDQSHRVNAAFNAQIDSLQRLSVTPELSYNENNSDSYTDAASTTMTGGLINTQRNHNRNIGRYFAINNNVNYSRRSVDRNTMLNINWLMNLSQSRANTRNESQNVFYNSGIIPSDTLDQQGRTTGNGINNNLSINLSRKLGRHFTSILNYMFMQSSDINNRDIFNYDPGSGKHDELDSLYSSHNKNTGITHLPTINIGYQGGKLSVELGAGLRWISQENRIVWKDSSVRINQRNFSPRISTFYQLTKTSQWIINYSVEAMQPAPDQLAPVQDNTDPLHIRVGNPFLRSAIMHNVSTQFIFFTRDYKWGLTLQGNSMISNNQIVNDTYYDNVGRQVTTYRNTSGNNQLNMALSGGTRIKIADWNFNLDFHANLVSNNTTGFVNRQVNRSTVRQFSPGLNFGMRYKEMLTLQGAVGIDINEIDYSLDNVQDLDYNMKRASMNLQLVPVKFLVFSSSVTYKYSSQLPADFQRSRTLVNAAVNYSVLKSRKLSAGISVNDLLNNNVNVSRTVSASAIETVQFNALRRFVMLNISYRLSKFGGMRSDFNP